MKKERGNDDVKNSKLDEVMKDHEERLAKSREHWDAIKVSHNAECQMQFLRALNTVFNCGYTIDNCPTLNLAVELILETKPQVETEPDDDAVLSGEESSYDEGPSTPQVKSEITPSPHTTPSKRVTRSATSAAKSHFPLSDNYAPCHILVRLYRYLVNKAVQIGQVGDVVSILIRPEIHATIADNAILHWAIAHYDPYLRLFRNYLDTTYRGGVPKTTLNRAVVFYSTLAKMTKKMEICVCTARTKA